jgi:LysR family hydrogen peroxide-inducible transcriptional activator
MELQQLRYLVAVADLGSFTKAAERCFVAQPSLSQQIIKLEKELGQPLFERLGRTIRLTDAGRLLYNQAGTILTTLEEAKRRVAELQDEDQGTVHVGAIPTIAPYFLPQLVASFQQRFPKAAVFLQEDFTESTIEHCLRGTLDVGILALPVESEHLHAEALFEEELLLALPANHPLTKKRRVSVEDITGEAFILVNEMHCLGQQIVAFCNRESCTPRVVCRSSQVLTVQELVAVGQGVSLLPTMACQNDRHSNRVYRHLSGRAPKRTIGMIWHKQRYQRPLVKKFVELIRAALATRLEF